MAQVCDHSIPGIAGSNSPGGMDVRLLCLLCVVHMAPLRRAKETYRLCVPTGMWSQYLKNETVSAFLAVAAEKNLKAGKTQKYFFFFSLWRYSPNQA